MPRRPRTAVLGAFACMGALAATGLYSHATASGRARDAEALSAFARLRNTRLDPLLSGVVHLADAVPYLLLCTAIVLWAVRAARPRTALAVGTVLVAAPLTAEILKHVTATARTRSAFIADHIAGASWPSGHATGAMALALCAVIVAPAALRPLVALVGGALAITLGYAVVGLVWHFPSDTIGAFLLAGAWALMAIAVLRQHPDPTGPPEPPRPPLGVWGVGLAVAVLGGGAVLLVAAVRFGQLSAERFSDDIPFVVAGGLIGVIGAVVAAVVTRSA